MKPLRVSFLYLSVAASLGSIAGQARAQSQLSSAEPRARTAASQTVGHSFHTSLRGCEKRYTNGVTVQEGEDGCAVNECASREVLEDCESANRPCALLASCTCNYEVTSEWSYTDWEVDTLLAGVMDLWQFDYGCSGNNNAVGCGPVAAASVLYWWAQQGYEELVHDALSGAGTGPDDRQHDWKDLVRTLRDDYYDGGLCVPFGGGQYAVLQDQLARGLLEYVESAGYRGSVGHYKVCADCNANGANELLGDEGLSLIQDELRAGRPVIMGFNAGQFDDGVLPGTTTSGERISQVFIGELSNGAPVTGIISHYAVVTGYRRLAEGWDVLTLNLGWGEDDTDTYVLWNPAGKWLHLYTLDIQSAPDGEPWCVIDRGLVDAFLHNDDLGISHADHLVHVPLAGSYCGIVRANEEVTISNSFAPGYTCQTELPPGIDPRLWEEAQADPRTPNDDGTLDILQTQGLE